MKKLTAIFLSILLLLSCLPLTAFAAPRFCDVPQGCWYADAVNDVADRGLMIGTSETTFCPSASISEAMLATILFRLSGGQITDHMTWYGDAMRWSAANDLTNFYDEPGVPVTRGQLFLTLYRYAGLAGLDVSGRKDIAAFSDAAAAEGSAAEALRWAYANALMSGRPNNLIAPRETATRAEVATVFSRFSTQFAHAEPTQTEPGVPEQTEPAMSESTQPSCPTDSSEPLQYCTVNFEANCTDAHGMPDAMSICKDSPMGEVAPPSRDGYSFVAWCDDAGVIYTSDSVINCNLTLYAQWREVLEGGTVFEQDPDNLSFDPTECVVYFNNLLNVFTSASLTDAQKNELAATVGGKLSGDIPDANFLQILVSTDSLAGLLEKAARLMSFDCVLYASYDVPMLAEPSSDNNPWKGETDRGNENNPSGNDWWAEAINAYTAWDLAENRSDVCVGIIDSGFDLDHKDFKRDDGTSVLQMLPGFPTNTEDDHGTHVAGIIAAVNNTFGIRGIADGVNVLCMDHAPAPASKNLTGVSSGEFLFATVKMITSGAKVINNSWGISLKTPAAYYTVANPDSGWLAHCWQMLRDNNADYRMYCNAVYNSARTSAITCTAMIYSLLANGYDDFLIVQSVGNSYSTLEVNGEYADLLTLIDIELNHKGFDRSAIGDHYCGITEDVFNSIYGPSNPAGLTYRDIKGHVLIVGAVSNDRRQADVGTVYRMTQFSSYGDTVDICAPGKNICSTLCNDAIDYLDGTSMAAPMVAGTAALIWSVNPDLSAAEVRQILLQNTYTFAEGVLDDDAGNIYPMLNAGDAVEKALAKIACTPIGTVAGMVCTAGDRTTPVANARVDFYDGNTLRQTIYTDPAGQYTVELPAVTYRITVSASGYIPFSSYLTVAEAQTVYSETFLMVEGSPEEFGTACGTVVNGVTGNGIEGVTVVARAGWNATDGEELNAALHTDTSGNYSITLPLGNYTLELRREGYVTTSINIVVQRGTTAEQNGTMIPLASGDTFRIVLTWDENPRDLDSHLVGKRSDGSKFHVYFSDKHAYDGDTEICNLDVDDTTSYGPETVTLIADSITPYYYYVHHYAGIGSIATSGAKVRVYQGEALIAEYNVPTDRGTKIYWNVFAIVNGSLITKNTMTDSPDTSYCS